MSLGVDVGLGTQWIVLNEADTLDDAALHAWAARQAGAASAHRTDGRAEQAAQLLGETLVRCEQHRRALADGATYYLHHEQGAFLGLIARIQVIEMAPETDDTGLARERTAAEVRELLVISVLPEDDADAAPGTTVVLRDLAEVQSAMGTGLSATRQTRTRDAVTSRFHHRRRDAEFYTSAVYSWWHPPSSIVRVSASSEQEGDVIDNLAAFDAFARDIRIVQLEEAADPDPGKHALEP